LLTNLSEAILANDEEKALQFVEEAHLWNYCVRRGKINQPKEQQRFTPLMLACYLGQTRVVEALLKKGFVNRQLLQTGDTAIFFALRGNAQNRAQLCKLLLANGASFKLTNRNGLSLLNIAVKEDVAEIVTHLRKFQRCTR
jgi:ankyrin repeat protein